MTASDEQSKKLKSGYHLTINDSALVQAEWPQLNVFRSASNTATYDTLSINEFCSGYLVNVRDCYMIHDQMLIRLLIIYCT